MTALADALARRRERSDSHVQLAAALTELLPGWSREPDRPHSSKLLGPNGGQLLIDVRTGGKSPRASIEPQLPDDIPWLAAGVRSKTITVALDRGPDAIDRESSRRVLPAYEADLKIAAEHRKAQRPSEERQQARAAAITALFPGSEARRPWHSTTELHVRLPGLESAEVTLGPNGRDTLRINSIPTPLLHRLLDTYRQTLADDDTSLSDGDR